MLFNVEINGQKITARRDETILMLLNRTGIRVPTICHMSGFTPTGACRMCVVEVEGMSGLVTACSHPVEDWMKIRTHSPRVLNARKNLVELLLSSHPDDCLYCDRSGSCELSRLADELNIRERKYRCHKKPIPVDRNCPSIERDPSKCILCGRCARVCDEIIGVSAIEFIGRGSKCMIGTSQNKGMNEKSCVKCGQCIMVCPTGSIREKPDYQKVLDALNDDSLHCVVQLSPTVYASIAEEFGMRSGKDIPTLLKIALRRMGFKQIFDVSFGADLSILDTASEFIRRIKDHTKLPLFTNCCPSWVHYITELNPELKDLLASAKSPQHLNGEMIKNYYAPMKSINTKTVFTVSVMPCTAKKFEAVEEGRPEGVPSNIDAVITIRELIRIIRLLGIDFLSLEPEPVESFINIQSSAGRLYGTAGGAMEGVIRTIHFLMTGQEMSNYKITELRGIKAKKEIRFKIGKVIYGFVAVSGLNNAKQLMEEIKAGRDDIHMVEVMVCPNGCVNGGGQRLGSDEKLVKQRIKALYDTDEEEIIRAAHKNPLVAEIAGHIPGLNPIIMNP